MAYDPTNYSSGWWFGTMEFYDFPETVGNVIIPTDELILFRGVGIPPNSLYLDFDELPSDNL